MKYLHSAVERIHDKNPVVMVDEQPCRQLELSGMRASRAKVIQQLALAVEDLHHAPHGIHHVQIAFRVGTDRLWPEHGSHTVADLPDGELEGSSAVKYLHPEIHGIHHHKVRPVPPQFGGEIELALGSASLADGLQHIALDVEDEHHVSQCVCHVNALRHRVHGNSGGPLEIRLAPLQAAE